MMRHITSLVVTLFVATSASAETVEILSGNGEGDQPYDICRNAPNTYSEQSCEQIRHSRRVTEQAHAQSEAGVATTPQAQPGTPPTQTEMPVWQQALQPPAPPPAAEAPPTSEPSK